MEEDFDGPEELRAHAIKYRRFYAHIKANPKFDAEILRETKPVSLSEIIRIAKEYCELK